MGHEDEHMPSDATGMQNGAAARADAAAEQSSDAHRHGRLHKESHRDDKERHRRKDKSRKRDRDKDGGLEDRRKQDSTKERRHDRERETERGDVGAAEPEVHRNRDRARDRDKGPGRDRDRDRDRDWGRDQDRDRGRDQERRRDGHRDRDRAREGSGRERERGNIAGKRASHERGCASQHMRSVPATRCMPFRAALVLGMPVDLTSNLAQYAWASVDKACVCRDNEHEHYGSKRARRSSPELEEGQLPAPPGGDDAMDVDGAGGMRSPRSQEARRCALCLSGMLLWCLLDACRHPFLHAKVTLSGIAACGLSTLVGKRGWSCAAHYGLAFSPPLFVFDEHVP